MTILLINEHDHGPASEAFIAAAVAHGHTPHSAYGEFAHALNDWGIGHLPCLAKIVDGRAVYQVSDMGGIAGFEADAANA